VKRGHPAVRPSSKASRQADCLDVLTGCEALAVLHELLSSHAELIPDARRASNALLASVSFAAVAESILLGLYRAEQRGFELLEYADECPSNLPAMQSTNGDAAATRRFHVCSSGSSVHIGTGSFNRSRVESLYIGDLDASGRGARRPQQVRGRPRTHVPETGLLSRFSRRRSGA
jgi:hypothetical protein